MPNNKKKVLVLTSIYPGPDIPNNFTPVVHYFVKEWINCENLDIKVIHLPAYYPKSFYIIPNFIKEFVSSKLGFPFPKKRLSQKLKFVYEGVSVYRMPLYKRIPMGSFAESEIKDKVTEIIKYLDENNFSPDIIIGHWFYPQVLILAWLKEFYKCKAILTLHETTDKYIEDPVIKEAVKIIDIWGYRNKKIKKNFFQNFGIMPFIHCPSGIPRVFVENQSKKEFKDIKRFIFVAGLLNRKYPDVIVSALSNIYKSEHFRLDIIGDGPLKKNLEKLINKKKVNSQVTLWGRKGRKDIIPLLDDSDIFVMISKNEAFGLVYLEAMARGCIVIASRNEGMEGIIKHGKNGFLCEAGNQQELEALIQEIRLMPSSILKRISTEAVKTASELTDEKAANKYIADILSN